MDGARAGVAPLAPTYREVATVDRLRAGWHRVWVNNGSYGGDGQSVGEFRERLHEEIDRLRDELVGHRYRPRPLRGVRIPKASGTTRHLLIPAVRDRVVQQAALSVLGPWLDVTLEAAGVVDLRRRAELLIDRETDRVHWYRTCRNCPGVLAAKPSFTLTQPTESTPWIV